MLQNLVDYYTPSSAFPQRSQPFLGDRVEGVKISALCDKRIYKGIRKCDRFTDCYIYYIHCSGLVWYEPCWSKTADVYYLIHILVYYIHLIYFI